MQLFSVQPCMSSCFRAGNRQLLASLAGAQVVSSINNLIIGKIYVDHGGIMRIVSSASGLVCKLRFKEQSRLRNREAHEVLRV